MAIDYNELFGIEPEIDTGAKEQEPADPAPEVEPEGVEEQEPAEPAEEPATAETDDNAKYAAARRKAEAERDAAIAKAKADADASIEDMIKHLGLDDPYNGGKITTKAQYDAYRSRYEKEQRDQMLRRIGVDEEGYSDFVNKLPEVKSAKEALAKADAERAQAQLAEDVRKISEIDAAVKSVEDIFSLPNYQAIRDHVARGVNLYDAYRLANFDTIVSSRTAAAKQAEANKAAGKQHMTTTAPRGTGDVDVPRDVMGMYRLLNPEMSAEDVRKHYQRYKKG